MHKTTICIYIAILIIKHVEAGVITSATPIQDTNNIDEAVQYPESDNDIRDEIGLGKKPLVPAKPVVYVKGLKKIETMLGHTRDAGGIYRDKKKMNKISSVITRVQNMLERNVISRYNGVELLPVFAELQESDSVQKQNENEDIVEISLPDGDAATEDYLSPIENDLVAENDDKKLMKEFIRSRTVIPTKGDCNSDLLEEKKDLDEFIFMLDLKDQDYDTIDDGDVTTTTAYLAEDQRFKRGVNMIEEENMGTTIAGFKFTGHDSTLSNDIYFKNINS